MNQHDSYFINLNKSIEEIIDRCLHQIENRTNKIYQAGTSISNDVARVPHKHHPSKPTVHSRSSLLAFKSPYIRDARDFSAPNNEDVRQINELSGSEDIEYIIDKKGWTCETKRQLKDAVLDHYSQKHLIKLIKQKNILATQLKAAPEQSRADLEQKLNLIDEQMEQVKSRKELRIFVPEDRLDPGIDWCSISAKMTNILHDSQDCRLMWTNELHWAVNDGFWTKEEDECLLNAVQKHGKNDWDAVARDLNSNRLAWQCCSRYNQELACSVAGGAKPISEDDIEKIIEVVNLCRIGDYVPWTQVMYFIKFYSLLQVKYQWQKLSFEKGSEKPWSHEEDVKLLKAVQKYGERDWLRISSQISGRSNKSCRERYTMRLKFDKRAVGAWKRGEDQTLIALVDRHGPNWSLISSQFSCRNQHQLRNRYALLKTEDYKEHLRKHFRAPVKHRKLYRDSEGNLTTLDGRRKRLTSEVEVQAKLTEIFTTFLTVNKSSGKSLVCRSAQDEQILGDLVDALRRHLFDFCLPQPQSLLSCVIDRVIRDRVTHQTCLLPPSIPTIRGFRAWGTQQSYLRQLGQKATMDIESISSTNSYQKMKKIVISTFLWPAVMAKLARPEVEIELSASIVDRNAKNLYKIRELQKRLSSSS